MTLFSYFFCTAYDAYNTTGKKAEYTLRSGAVSLISFFELINVISVIALISLIEKRTFITPLGGLSLAVLLGIYNSIIFSKNKGASLREQYHLMPDIERKRLKRQLLIYKIVSIAIISGILAATIYYKKKYGNYDLLK